MTKEEQQLISACCIMVHGKTDFIGRIRSELSRLGFKTIEIVSEAKLRPGSCSVDIVVEDVAEGTPGLKEELPVPIIYPFDFIDGAGAIVLLSEDDRDMPAKPGLRLWAAEYMAGYSDFWDMSGCEWLRDVLPRIRKGVTSLTAQTTAAYVCARIAANIAVGQEIKHFPRFYLCKNLE